MKVCILTTSFPAYKDHFQSPFVYKLAKSLVDEDIKVSLVCPFYKNSKKKNENIDGIRVFRFQYFFPRKFQKLTSGGGIPTNLKSSFFAKIQFPLFLFSFFLKSIKSTRKCDVIHAQWALSALMGVFLKKLFKKPLILTTRGAAVDLALKSSIGKKVLMFVLRNCDYITPNNYKHEDIILKLGISKEIVKTIPNGVDIELFNERNKNDARIKLGLPINKKILLSIGWLIERKGHNYVIDAMKELVEKYNDLIFIIIGDGILEDKLKSQINKLKLKDNIILVGSQAPSKIPLWMNAADFFILSSLSEGRPNVVPEALASGLPVIATRVSGTPEFIDNNVNGVLIEPKSSSEIFESVSKFMTDGDFVKKLKQNARKSVIDKGLTWKTCADNYVEIYNFLSNLNT